MERRVALVIGLLCAACSPAQVPSSEAAPAADAPAADTPAADAPAADAPASAPLVEVVFPASSDATANSGRVLVIFAKQAEPEPRFAVGAGLDAAQIVGVDVEALAPAASAFVHASDLGFPKASLAELSPGNYTVQAVFHAYENFELANGKRVQLPMDAGEGQHWNKSPGNRYSTPQTVHFDPSAGPLRIELDQVIAPIEAPVDTKYVKHLKFESKLLSEFWGRPMYLGAHLLLPEGFEEHPEARYPLVVFHGHHHQDFGGFRPEPPDPELEPDYSERFGVEGYNRTVQAEAHAFYQRWVGPDFPRMLIVDIQHANPYYDDSYAVNSANLGPYGDAITHELIPHIEQQFRGLGQGWARFLYGGSTGGWEAMAAQVFYPEEYNGAFIACPDPIDFRAYTLINLYEDDNAYYEQGPFKRIERPGHRNYLGEIDSTIREQNQLELVLGTHSRSGDQWDIWQAVYSPMGEDGYPKPIWDKRTGVIDRSVADYWRENYDLRHILARDWESLGPKLRGKLHIYVGDMDNYYLNNAVYLTEAFLAGTSEPPYEGEVAYGDRAEHCWNGDPEQPNHITRLRYHTMYVDKILARIEAAAPADADLDSWRY